MDLDDLLPPDLNVQDALDPSSGEQLATACQALDLPVPRADDALRGGSPERLARARAERQKRLSEALALTLNLVKSSGYDIQALTVLMRLSIEAGAGAEGCEQALSVLSQVLNRGWSGLARVAAEQSERDREKLQRRWARYLDAVFEQLYLWLAREHEQQPEVLCPSLQQAAPAWRTLFADIERGLQSSGVRLARFEAVSELFEQLSHTPAGAAGATPSPLVTGSAEPSTSSEAPASSKTGAESLANAGSGVVTEARASLQVSARFWELQQRLAAFAELLERREYEKAGIVAADLQKTLEQFDVSSYFPGLFARYFECCAEHARQLVEHHPDKSGLRSSALSSLYRADLARFLELRAPRRGD